MVEKDEAFDPVDVGLLGLVAVVPETENVTGLLQQFRLVDF